MRTAAFYFGIIFIAILTFLVDQMAISHLAQQYQLSALTLAILLGMLLGNTIYPKVADYTNQGILFAKGSLLRLGIILYGFRLTLQDINNVGLNAIATDAIILVSTFFLALFLGIRWLKMDKQTVYLIAGGCSICGAAAIMAMEPVTKAKSHQISIAVAVIVLFGSLSMFLYPIAYPYLQSLMSEHQFGIFIGSTVHEVAQVYAAGGNINPAVADTAVIAKMIRVMMLAPFLFILSWALSRQTLSVNESAVGNRKINLPWFALCFILTALFNSLELLPSAIVNLIIKIDNLLLIAAMTALGLTTQFNAIKQAGLKPLLLGGLIYFWLTLGGFAINLVMQYGDK